MHGTLLNERKGYTMAIKPQAAPKVAPKPSVEVIVSDIDNTITDFFGQWAKITDDAIGDLAESRNKMRGPNDQLKKDDLLKEMSENASGEHVFHNLEQTMAVLPSLKPRNEAEKKAFAKDDAKIIHNWKKDREGIMKPYEGVKETMEKAKAAGTKIVLYTDSPVTSTMHRASILLGKDADRLVDAIYTQPDAANAANEKPAMPVKAKHADVLESLAKKTTVLPRGSHKPNPETLASIVQEFGADPKKVVMVGDTYNDVAGAPKTGEVLEARGYANVKKGDNVIAAWQRAGADVNPRTVELASKAQPDKDYKIGIVPVQEKMKANGVKPDVVLGTGWPELSKRFQFDKFQQFSKPQVVVSKTENRKLAMTAALNAIQKSQQGKTA
jgi:phosphoglycolate phosphatase-like HAD superfamily hydrolase